ncbi:MAG: tRNA dihydrouridine synthase DusB [Chthoniobacterales bacterium]
MLHWFQDSQRPLYLAPMAGVTDSVFRRLCKELGADVTVTEFVSAEGILHRNQRTQEMIYFDSTERPIGVQLFGAEPDRLAEAAKAVIDWVQPDFIDLNFGCPVNKVVSRHGGAALLRDCPLLEKVASAVVRAANPCPVTAKIRLGWSAETVNATETGRILEAAGVEAIAVHGRTKEQGYTGSADWDRIAEVADAISLPVIGNGDVRSLEEVAGRFRTTRVRGLMIGRAAMTNPWLFRQARYFLERGEILPDPTPEDRWKHIVRHCSLAVSEGGPEKHTMSSLRARLMAYSRGMPGGRWLRSEFQHVTALAQIIDLAASHLDWIRSGVAEPEVVEAA